MKIVTSIIITLMTCLLLACNQASEDKKPVSKIKSTGRVLATIDGMEIRESQLDATLTEMFGSYKTTQMDETSRRKVLDSMLAAHALSQQALNNLPAKKINAIKEKTRRYRENMLINTYMQTKMDASTLSRANIKAYYEANLDKFGKQVIKEYQLLTTQQELAEEQRDKYLALISKNKNRQSLKEIRQQLEKQNFDVRLHSGALDNNMLNKRLYNFINAQTVNQISEVSFINNKPYLAVVTAEKILKPKPLTEVRDIIRKTLLLKQLKQTIKTQSADAIAKSEIVYQDR